MTIELKCIICGSDNVRDGRQSVFIPDLSTYVRFCPQCALTVLPGAIADAVWNDKAEFPMTDAGHKLDRFLSAFWKGIGNCYDLTHRSYVNTIQRICDEHTAQCEANTKKGKTT